MEGNLSTAGITKQLSLSTSNQTTITSADADKLKITIAPKTGLVTGSFIFPVTKKTTTIKGVILQNKIGKAVGGFIGSTFSHVGIQTGRLDFSPTE